MHLRLLPLLLCAGLLAACGSGRSAAAVDGMRFDTVAGFRLGMLLPEAREAAARRGDRLLCEPATSVFTPQVLGDSVYRAYLDVDFCEPPEEHYRLEFKAGSLRQVKVPFTEDWERVPLDTVIGRLTAKAGAPEERQVYTYGDGDRELLVHWRREGLPGIMALRCPAEGPAKYCVTEHYLVP